MCHSHQTSDSSRASEEYNIAVFAWQYDLAVEAELMMVTGSILIRPVWTMISQPKPSIGSVDARLVAQDS